MGAASSGPEKPTEAQVKALKEDLSTSIAKAAKLLDDAEVFLLMTGAGFSADSGLAVYADVARIDAYKTQGLEYYDLCQPHWLQSRPDLFWGFWGQCFNDYRNTAPHVGYEILSKWAAPFRETTVAEQIRRSVAKNLAQRKVEVSGGPYGVGADLPGAFFAFTSNVDAHHFDWFPPHEVRECHGNVELLQCEGPCTKEVWRAPKSFHFRVDKRTMLAPAGPSGSPDDDEDAQGDHVGPQGPRIGQVKGGGRPYTLRYLASPPDEVDTYNGQGVPGFESNHPTCPRCGGRARPAILMFKDRLWNDLEAQEQLWEVWVTSVAAVAKERTKNKQDPLKVIILEIGCGNNVTTVRRSAELTLGTLLDGGADAKLVRVNPDFPLGDDGEFRPNGKRATNVVSIAAKGLNSLKNIKLVREGGSGSMDVDEVQQEGRAQDDQDDDDSSSQNDDNRDAPEARKDVDADDSEKDDEELAPLPRRTGRAQMLDGGPDDAEDAEGEAPLPRRPPVLDMEKGLFEPFSRFKSGVHSWTSDQKPSSKEWLGIANEFDSAVQLGNEEALVALQSLGDESETETSQHDALKQLHQKAKVYREEWGEMAILLKEHFESLKENGSKKAKLDIDKDELRRSPAEEVVGDLADFLDFAAARLTSARKVRGSKAAPPEAKEKDRSRSRSERRRGRGDRGDSPVLRRPRKRPQDEDAEGEKSG